MGHGAFKAFSRQFGCSGTCAAAEGGTAVERHHKNGRRERREVRAVLESFGPIFDIWFVALAQVEADEKAAAALRRCDALPLRPLCLCCFAAAEIREPGESAACSFLINV